MQTLRPFRSRSAKLALLAALAGCAPTTSAHLVHVADIQRQAAEKDAAQKAAAAAAAQGARPSVRSALPEDRKPQADTTRKLAAGSAKKAEAPAAPAPVTATAAEVADVAGAGPVPERKLPVEVRMVPRADAPAAAPARPAPARAERAAAEPVRRAPAPRRSTPQGMWIHVEGEQAPVRFTFEDALLSDVMSGFSEVSGRDIVLHGDVRDKRVTANIREQPWHLALEAILASLDLRPVESSNGILLVVTKDRAQETRQSYRYVLNHRLAKDVQGTVKMILGLGADSTRTDALGKDGVEIVGDEKTSRTITVFASPDKHAHVSAELDRLDSRPPRVLLDARLVKVSKTEMQSLGISYTQTNFRDSLGIMQPGFQVQPTGGFSSKSGRIASIVREIIGGGGGTKAILSVNAFVDALIEDGVAETETSTSIAVNTDHTGEIRIGDAIVLQNQQPILFGGGGAYVPQQFGQGQQGQMPGQQGQVPGGFGASGGYGQQGGGYGQAGIPSGGFQEFESGTYLKITPYVANENEAEMVLELVRDGGKFDPQTRTISGGRDYVSTRVVAFDGIPMVIGGLNMKASTRLNGGIPGLSRLPLIGRLFRKEEWANQTSELMVIITPHIIYDSPEATRARP